MAKRLRLRLVHWNKEEGEARARSLRSSGYDVEAGPIDPAGLKSVRARPPAAVVIDLTRTPSLGREIGVALRSFRSTRFVPLVFVEGEAAKVDRIRALLPDAVYASWRGVRGALRRAIARPPAAPIIPSSIMAAYSGTPLLEKLGIREGTAVSLIDPPDSIDATLGDLPAGARLTRGRAIRGGVILWFVRSRADLDRRIGTVARAVGDGSVWILWPKKASGVTTDLTQPIVRREGLATGLVDFKICAFDATWSGLRFVRRRERN